MSQHVISRTFGTISVVVLAACSATEPTHNLRLDVALDRNVVDVQDSVHMTLTLSNVSDRAVHTLAADAYGACMHAFEAFDPAGRQVTTPTAICLAIQTSLVAGRVVELGPFERMTITDWWVLGQSTVNGQSLSPGTYRLRGAVGAESAIVRSRPLLIEVLDRPSFLIGR
jgi:hypothetical protein